ncbi:helix-turn-helix transcriptional regulator [Phenylobacterium sp.]|uniref:helix-turn-helix domain-containing protein n=1 Tax=Phenylobacterium sp. TaxID=1871053 RepID=UPI002E343199|nr:helix-turn-helix transcriptional regulator [Phenylobacterium sp.]HEX3365709.1 helix-turn-helix transcriptional regulator [Phenylobacterium sp.]
MDVLVEARDESGLTQAEIAKRVGKDQSFMSLIENSQRRVDVLEFFALANAMEADALALLAKIAKRLPSKIQI